MHLSNLDIRSFPLGVSKGLDVKITLGLAARNVVSVNYLIFFSKLADFFFFFNIWYFLGNYIFFGPISLSLFKPLNGIQWFYLLTLDDNHFYSAKS